MGIPGPRDADFLWNICLCDRKFKGPNGRSEWQKHIVDCKVMKAQRGEPTG